MISQLSPVAAFRRLGRGGLFGRTVTAHQLVEVSCSTFAPTSLPESGGTVTVGARLNNTTEEDHDITWRVTFNVFATGFELRSDWGRDTAPAGSNLVFDREVTIPDGELPPAGTEVSVGIEQRFGHQQSDFCGLLEITEPEPEPEFDPDRVEVPTDQCTVVPQSVEPPQSVSLSAVVVNENDVPAAATISWTWAGEELATAGVNVSAKSQANAEATATIDREGNDQVRAEVTNATESVEGLSPNVEPVRAGASNEDSH